MGKWLAVAAALAVLTGCNLAHHEVACTSGGTQCKGGSMCDPTLMVCTSPDPTCSSGHRIDDPTGGPGQCANGPPVDAAIDAPEIDARVCFGTSIVQVCLASPPPGPLMIPDIRTIDTSMPSMCA